MWHFNLCDTSRSGKDRGREICHALQGKQMEHQVLQILPRSMAGIFRCQQYLGTWRTRFWWCEWIACPCAVRCDAFFSSSPNGNNIRSKTRKFPCNWQNRIFTKNAHIISSHPLWGKPKMITLSSLSPVACCILQICFLCRVDKQMIATAHTTLLGSKTTQKRVECGNKKCLDALR